MQKPWRDETFTLKQFPRCAAYLNGMGCRLEQFPVSDYYAAVILADAFGDADFEAANVDYSNTPGSRLLIAIERMFYSRKVSRLQKPAQELSESMNAQLMAFLGSRGVKTSMLANDDEIWKAAMILWPTLRREEKLEGLVWQIRSFSKAKRKIANANVKNLPDKWKAC